MSITNFSGPMIKLADDLSLDSLPPLTAFQYLLDDVTCIRRGVKCIHTNPASCWIETVSEVRGRKETPHFVEPQERIPDGFVSRITVTGIPNESYEAWIKSLPTCVKHFASQCPSPFATPKQKNTVLKSTEAEIGHIKTAEEGHTPSKRERGSNKSRVCRIHGRSVRVQPYHEQYDPPSSLDEYVIDRLKLPLPHPRNNTKSIIPKVKADDNEVPPPVGAETTDLMQMLDEQRVMIDMLQQKVELAQSKRRRLRRSVNIILESLKAHGLLTGGE